MKCEAKAFSRSRILLAFKRNSLLILIVSSIFLLFMCLAICLVIIVNFLNPAMIETIISLVSNYPFHIPEPETPEFFLFIFANNIGYYWNPQKLLVWTPLIGVFILGLSLLLNGVVIGAAAAILGLKYSPIIPLVGFLPHGVIEVPAFMLQCAAILRWHITTSTLLLSLIRGENIDKTKIRNDLVDILILSVISIVLLCVAALIESYITPPLIRLVFKENVETFV